MPTLLTKDGLKFFFYANDHEPMHIHIMKGDDYAKIDLYTLEIVYSCLSLSDCKKSISIIKEYREEFEEKWDAFSNKR